MKKANIIIVVVTFIGVFIELFWGKSSVEMGDLWKVLWVRNPNHLADFILWDYRIPKLLTAYFAGLSLSVSGLLMQTLFRNPLAGPYVLGISSGASFGVGLLILGASLLPVSAYGFLVNSVGVSFMGIAGAFFILGSMLWAASRVSGNFTILILGLILGQILAALQGVFQFVATPDQLKRFSLWSLGSFSNTTLGESLFLAAVAIMVLVVSIRLSGHLNLYALGDLYFKASTTRSLTHFRRIVIALAGMTAGLVTAYCGPIAFVGMIVPHIATLMIQKHNHRARMITAALLGGCLALCCDLFSHLGVGGHTLPVNIVFSLIGGPVVVWVVLKQKGGYEFG